MSFPPFHVSMQIDIATVLVLSVKTHTHTHIRATIIKKLSI